MTLEKSVFSSADRGNCLVFDHMDLLEVELGAHVHWAHPFASPIPLDLYLSNNMTNDKRWCCGKFIFSIVNVNTLFRPKVQIIRDKYKTHTRLADSSASIAHELIAVLYIDQSYSMPLTYTKRGKQKRSKRIKRMQRNKHSESMSYE